MFSEPVVGEKFFGREEVLELLSKRACALKDGYRQNVALTGQSLAGKSSVILHFLHTVRQEGFIPVYVEVLKEPFKSFSNKFIATMLYNALSKEGNDPDVSLESLFSKAQQKLPKTYQATRQVLASIDRGDFEDGYTGLLGLTSILKEETGEPCIVILDEFDNLEHLGVRNPYLGFGKVIMVQKDTMYIVSSSRNMAIRKIISEKLSLLFGNFEVVKIANFGAKASCRFVDLKLPLFEISDFARKFLFVFTDGNPFYLDKIASRLKELASERMTRQIQKELLVDAIIDVVYRPGGAVHQYLMNYMLELLDTKNRDLQTSLLVSIASGANRQPDMARTMKTRKADISKALTYLMENALISKNGVFYRIEDSMFEFWLKNVYQRRKEILVDGAFNRIELFKSDLRAHMDSYEKTFSENVTSRLAELFSAFSNELVHLEMKNTRLARFTKVETRSFDGSRPFIAASFRGCFWIAQAYERTVNENDIITFVRDLKSLDCRISNKVIIPLKGIEENAKLIAKELRLSIWDAQTTNMLLGLYGKKRMALL